MVRKILLYVYVVAMNVHCEFCIPVNMKVENAITLMKKLLCEEYKFNPNDLNINGYLIFAENGLILNSKKTFMELEIETDEKYILG